MTTIEPAQPWVLDGRSVSIRMYASRLDRLSLFNLSWRLGAGGVSVRELAHEMLDECQTWNERRQAAYVLLVGSINDVPRLALSAEELVLMTTRALVAWWYAVTAVIAADVPRQIVETLLRELATPGHERPPRSRSRLLRDVFVTYWRAEPVDPVFARLPVTAEAV